MARRYRRLSRVLSLLLPAALGLSTASVRADVVDDVSKKMVRNQGEVRRIDDGIRPPSQVGKSRTSDAVSRKLVDAQVQFGMGNYDDASVLLYDIVESHKNHPSYDEALYYLAESLFQKGDNLAARAYFKRLLTERGTRSRFYQQTLERLIELSLRLQDNEGIEELLAAIDQLPANTLRPSVSYVRGKYSFFQGDHDRAIELFAKVPAKSKYSFQAQYFTGAAHVAKGAIGNAGKTYAALIQRQPRTDDDRRIVELSHMALGRLYYERDQPSKSIDSYLNVDRKSDLFDDVLYEVAWVYVKNREYPKALRALELLELTDPKSSRMPEVRILEGNLRIRKAQVQYDRGTGNPAEEYDKALKVFSATRQSFTEPRAALDRLLAEQGDASQFIEQVLGRESKTFETSAELPEVAVAWLREEPEVARMVAVEGDLGSIEKYIDDTEKTIRRLELALTSDARVDIFPELAERRYRILDIREETDAQRGALLAYLEKATAKVASENERQQIAAYQRDRERIAADLEQLSGTATATKRAETSRDRFDTVDQTASELNVIIESTEAQIAALETYLASSKELPGNVEEIRAELAKQKQLVVTMRGELEELRADTLVGRDAAGGSANAERDRTLRDERRDLFSAETKLMAGIVPRLGGKSRSKADAAINLLTTAQSMTEQTDRVLAKIEAVVDAALVEVRAAVDEERAKLGAYKREFLGFEGESRGLGTEVLASAFSVVSAKFRDVLMRADVGIVDVTWSHKESNERLRRRLVLDRARERRTLDSDFGDVVQELRAEREREQAEQAEQAGTTDTAGTTGEGANP